MWTKNVCHDVISDDYVIDLGVSKYSVLCFILCIHLLKTSSWFSFITNSQKLLLVCLLIGFCYSLSLTILHPWLFPYQLVSLGRFSSHPEEGIFTWFRKLLQTHLTLWPRFPLTVISSDNLLTFHAKVISRCEPMK